MFQFLIGRLGTWGMETKLCEEKQFQFLIGRLGTDAGMISTGIGGGVSIPYR